jgi:hypothetical protein
MTTIPVEHVPLDFDSPGYETPEEAIAAGLAHPLQAKAREVASHLLGRNFVRLEGSPEQWLVEFSDSVWLRVYLDGKRVGWSVGWDRPDAPAVGPFALQFDGGGRVEVDPEALSDARRGAAFRQLWVDELGFYVYLRGNLILSFSPVRRRDNGQVLLYPYEEV